MSFVVKRIKSSVFHALGAVYLKDGTKNNSPQPSRSFNHCEMTSGTSVRDAETDSPCSESQSSSELTLNAVVTLRDNML